MSKILNSLKNVFRFHKKKILFLIGTFLFCFILLFPFDDLSDFITLNVTKLTQSNVYLQFDGLSFGFLPQLGIKMENVVIESVFAPTISVKTLGFAPKITSLLTRKMGGKLKAYGLFSGDASVDFGPSNELETEGEEIGIKINLDKINLKDLSKFLNDSYRFPLTMKGETDLKSNLYLDPSFKEQPKGDLYLTINKLEIPSSNIALGNSGMSMAFPSLKLNQVSIVGNINDRKFFIKEGKIGDLKDDLHGEVTGDIFIDFLPGGRLQKGGYDLKVNLNVSENLKRQLGTVLGFIDIYQGIGEKHKFDSLKGVRYSMRLTARSFDSPPRVTSN
jgi:type II secretion system protein N